MRSLDDLKSSLGDDTKDLRLNLGNVLDTGDLEPGERWATALASAYFLRAGELVAALTAAGAPHLTPAAIADARAAAAIMGMNTVYYRFRHMIGKPSYSQRQAGLRMSRMGKPATTKGLFELASMACAVLAGCEACIKAHEHSLLHEGYTEDRVHQAVRIAAVVQGFAIAVAAETPAGVS
ncbi:carboxymuconolactone decarboxylase family protein [Planctomyces sp. SH-PL62]|uniref:carboxymuconolactone decarboxylase family protein n=1 Tax=Planctomyces sp. SH-PL62 TaxID=1636152 RepID=UPI00078DBF09|nr:carboxymuconolactone decarboxylase family protein [Planctomyces sp. SH-PL62]AMV36485.1 Alkyl hydroperoxide reductase AhpD [Planctomyces sp. SH-PL62]